MGFGVVADLIVHSGCKNERSTILEFCVQFPFKAQQNVALRAPVICDIARCVFDHSDSNLAEVASSPGGMTRVPFVNICFDLGPISGAERNVGHLHE